MEISKARIITWHRAVLLVNGDEGTGRKVFSWKPGDRVVATVYSFCLEIKSLAYEGGAGNGAYRLSRIDLHARLLPPGVAATATVEVVVLVPILVVVVVYSKGGPLGLPTHS